MALTGIYEIVCKTGTRYIGSSIDIEYRWSYHRDYLSKQIHPNIRLQRAWNKYGPKAFEFRILEECNRDSLLSREQFWIDSFDDVFNLAQFTGRPPLRTGVTLTEEHKKAIGDSNRGKERSEETKKKLSTARRQRVTTEETRQKMSKTRRGVPKSEEHKKAISDGHRRRKEKGE